jgi:hypothetical protein
MPDVSSVEPAFALSRRTRGRMILWGGFPGLHLVTVLALAGLAVLGVAAGLCAALALAHLYLTPPLLHRLLGGPRRLPRGRFGVDSPEFLLWWRAAQLQTIFNRLPFLEELLRLLPGVYSLWLRLWGARVGRLVYWTPGVVIADRSLVAVGDRVVFGAAVRVMPHLIAPDDEGRTTLLVDRVTLGDDALVGGYSLLTPGARVEPGEITSALRTRYPYREWRRPEESEASEPGGQG